MMGSKWPWGKLVGCLGVFTLTHNRKDVPDWVKDDLAMQKNTWEAVAKELEKVEPGCVGKLLA
jgi:hypothetical protein